MNVNNITCGHARLKVPCSFHLARVCFLAQLTEVLPPLPFPAPPLCTALNIYTWKNRTRSTPCNTARTHSKTINLLLSKLRQSLVFASVHCWIFSKAILGRTLWIRVLFQDMRVCTLQSLVKHLFAPLTLLLHVWCVIAQTGLLLWCCNLHLVKLLPHIIIMTL